MSPSIIGHYHRKCWCTLPTILIDVINSSAKAKQTTMPTVNQMNAARQQGADARVQIDAELLNADAHNSEPLPHARISHCHQKTPPPWLDASPRHLERMTKPLLRLGHLLLLTAAWGSVLMPSQLMGPSNASSLITDAHAQVQDAAPTNPMRRQAAASQQRRHQRRRRSY